MRFAVDKATVRQVSLGFLCQLIPPLLGTLQLSDSARPMCTANGSRVTLPALQITMLNAGRKYMGTDNLAGRVFVTSGLGGMSGAQAKAAVIAGCIGVIAEVRLALCVSFPCSSFYFLLPSFLFLLFIFLHLFLSTRRMLGEEMLCISQVSLEALKKRHAQGWLHEMESDLNQVMLRIREARRAKQVGYRRQHYAFQAGLPVRYWDKDVRGDRTADCSQQNMDHVACD
jgi:hypothetical protein